jgi:hypothetical protein
VRWSVSVTAGIRAAQLANTKPLTPKTTNVAAAAAVREGPAEVLEMSVFMLEC